MSSEKYLDWCTVPNTVNKRLKNNSLVHTFTREKKIRKSTKLINKTFEQKFCKTTYSQFKQHKQKILKELSENNDVIDKSDFSDTYYKSYYDSFDTSLANLHNEDFLWHIIDKKGRNQDKAENSEMYHIWEPAVDISIIKTAEDFEKLCDVSKIRKPERTIENGNFHKKKVAAKNLKSKNTTINSITISNKKVSSVNSKVAVRKNASTKEKQSPKSKQLSNKSFKDVKKNLTSALDNVSLRSQEFAGDESYDVFTSTEFQAQSTQLISDTFSEEKANSRPSIDQRLPHEVINQPRDSGIEEDSREDNIKFENPVDEKKYNKNGRDEENDESEIFKEKTLDNLKVDDNNLYQNEMKKSPYKKVPLKIIGEEKVTKKFKIITNKDKELKPVEEEKNVELLKAGSTSNAVNSINERTESSSESDSEFADCHNADDSQCNKSNTGSSDEYYDLQDGVGEGDSENSQNKHENEKAESDNSSTNESIIRKRELKKKLKNCKSPFIIRRYNELKRSGVLEESDVESSIKLIKSSEKKLKRTLITPSKRNKSKIKKISQLKAAGLQDTPKTQKQVKDDESFEEKTLVAENFNDISPNSERQQMKRLQKLSTSEDSEESENESKDNKINKNDLNLNTPGTKIEKPVLSKSKKDDSDSTVSETTNSQTSSKSKQCIKNKEKIKLHDKLADKYTSSACEESVEIGNQSDLTDIVNDYKQTLLSPIPKLTEDVNESEEPPNIDTQFQPMESPVHEDSDDSKNSEVEKTVINLKNQNEMQEKEISSDSEKKDESLKSESPKVNKIKQKAKTLKESSSEEDTNDIEKPKVDTSIASVNKNEDSEDECIMSSKSKEKLNKIKRLDLLNSDEDSDDSQDGIIEKNHCNSDVDIEEHKIEGILSYDDSQKKDKISLKKLKSSDCESYSEIPSVTNKSKSKLSSEFASFQDSGAVPDIADNSSNSSINKSKYKRKFTHIDSAVLNDSESGASQEIDVLHYSSENDINDKKKIKKLKSSNFGASMIVKEKNIDALSPNSFKSTNFNTVSSENENDVSDSNQTVSYSSKQKILRLKKINLLANNSSSSSEDEKTIEKSHNKWKKDHKKGTANKNSALNDSDCDFEKKEDLLDFHDKINKKQNQVKENEELDGKDDKSDVENQKDYILDDKNSKSEDSEDECTMSSKTKERLNKMKRLDLLNSDEDSDNSEDSNKDKNYCNRDVDFEEHKVENIAAQTNLKKNNETLKSQINSSNFDSETIESAKSKSKTKTKNPIKEKLKSENAKKNEKPSKKSSKLTSTLVPTGGTKVDKSFEEDKDESKESKKSKKKVIIQETQESLHSQKSILESQPMFSSLEDLREGIDEKQLNLEVESDVTANSLKDASLISSTQAPIKMYTDKVTKISELVEKESLEKITCQSTISVNNISADEDIYLLEVPKTMFNENLVGKKFSFSKTTLTVGNNKYEAFQKQVSPTYSCIFKTEKKALGSFTTQNIRPVATIIARRKKFIVESAKVTNNEIDDNIHESSTDNETKNLDIGNNSSKDKSTETKVEEKVSKKLKKSEEKEVLESFSKSNKEESKKVILKKNNFNLAKKVTKASAPDNSEKRSKKLKPKLQTCTDDTLNNDKIAKSENLDNNNLSYFSEEVLTQTTEKKTLIKKDINVITSKDNVSKKAVKSSGKLKKIKSPAEDVKETKDEVADKKMNIEPVKKLAKSESKSLAKKRKAESQLNEDANSDEKQETRKKKKVVAEKKEKKHASKAVNPRKSKKKVVNQSGESAADQIRRLIAKNIKFDDSLNTSFDRTNYNPLDIERVPKKPKRCQSTSSSSSDNDSKFTRRSFQMRVKTKPKDDKAADASSEDGVKSEDKKSVKKVFFTE